LETEDAAARIAEIGVPCCEVFLETFSEYTAVFGALVRERLGGTEAVSVHCKTQHFESDLIGLSARQRADAAVHLAGFLEAARALGAGIYVFHGPARFRQSAPPDFSRWHAGIQAAIDLSASYGVRLCYETVSWAWLNEPVRVKQFLAIWPSLSFVLDVKQVLEMGQDPVAYVEMIGDRLAHVHILDFDRDGRHVLPGQGAHDFRDLARALSYNGYDGAVILEPYGTTAKSVLALSDSINWLRGVFGARR